MGTLLDASVLIAAERRQLDLDVLRRDFEGEHWAMAAITVSEMLHGLIRASDEHKARREEFIERLLIRYEVVPFDLDVSRVHARIWAKLTEQGTAIGAHDLIVAATAMHFQARVATRDLRSFPRIPGLEVVHW